MGKFIDMAGWIMAEHGCRIVGRYNSREVDPYVY